METAAQTCDRLVTALEDLFAREAVTLSHGNVEAAMGIQERASSLVEYLSVHGPRVADAALRDRIGALCERRSATSNRLAAEIVRVRDELGTTRMTQLRVAQIAPVYGRNAVASRQLSAVG